MHENAAALLKMGMSGAGRTASCRPDPLPLR